MSENITDRPLNRAALLRRMVAEDAQAMSNLRVERMTAETGNQFNYDYLRTLFIQTIVDFGLVGKNLPRGYRVLGTGTSRTPHYLVTGGSEAKPSDQQFIGDLMSGLIEEVNAFLQKELAAYKAAQQKGGAR